MNRRTLRPRGQEPAAEDEPAGAGAEPEAIDFVRFCYRRRRVGWPELYDEMCGVASRGLYRGLGSDDLARLGIGFSLFEMPGLAVLVSRVVAEDQERRRRAAVALQASQPAPLEQATDVDATPVEVPSAEPTRIRLAVPAGA